MYLNAPFSMSVTESTNPSLRIMLANACFILECGISTRACRARTAFRIRVSMSAIGSVIVSSSLLSSRLPARLGDAGDHPQERQAPEADPAHLELAHEAPRPAAAPASVAVPDGKLRLPAHRRHPGCRRHRSSVLLVPA